MRSDSGWKKHCAWWLLSLAIPLVVHATTADDFANRHALITDGSSPVWRVQLNASIYAVSAPANDLRDLVVLNADGQQVPFGPLPPNPPRAQLFTLQTTLLPLPSAESAQGGAVRVQRNSDGTIVIEQPSTPSTVLPPWRTDQWLLDAGRRTSLERIEIDASALTDDARFELSVQASNDLQHWSTRGAPSEIVNVRHAADALTQRTITVTDATPARYYRLTLRAGDHAPWDSAQTPLVTLRGRTAGTPGGHAAARRWLDAPAAVTSASASGVDYDYTLPAALPLEAARIILIGANTVARYQLSDRDDGSNRLLAIGDAVQIGNVADDGAISTFAPVRAQHLRVHIDTPLAQPPNLRVAWRPDVFVFLAEGKAPYSLLAGSYAARRGNYPLQAALQQIRPADTDANWQPPLATLGAPTSAGGPAALRARASARLPLDWMRLLLWVVLIGGALAVVAMAWRLLRQSPNDRAER